MKPTITHKIYLDETGDANLLKINQQFPIFGLGGVIIPVKSESAMDSEFFILKDEIFGNGNIVLHSTDLRKARNGFEAMLIPSIREKFYENFNSFIVKGDLNFISVFIKKTEHLLKYKSPFEPYEWSIELILERIAKIMHRIDGYCQIILESRGKKEDKAIKDAIIRHLYAGCRYVSASSLKERISEVVIFEPKSQNGMGLQLSDMMLYPIARAIINNSPTNPAYHIVSSKMDEIHGCRVFPTEFEPQWVTRSYLPAWRSQFQKDYPPSS